MNQNIGYGATINGKHTWRDFQLVVSNTDVVGMPEPKTIYVDIPGSSKRLDLTETLTGKCEYGPRTLSFTLGGISDMRAWPERLSAFTRHVHGKQVRVILDSEPEYVYVGRATVKSFERTRALGKIELNIICEPYKQDLVSTGEDWIWDPFNFESGRILDYQNIQVTGYKKVKVEGSHMDSVPSFILTSRTPGTTQERVYSARLKKYFNLSVGNNRFAELIIKPDGDELTFYGTYTLTIDMRGGSL
ncbi:hypothetical protein [Alloscardovia omnicolens]|uniref:hypothetical protein n=1 Tax=Alloscardovia omnicolens TaxID=419015 RepID=UPI003A6EB217